MYADLYEQLDALLERDGPVLVAIDGYCASGKTTLAQKLSEKYDCNVFHMDDFFLQPQQRTPERFAQPGGNVDYERFHQEVLQSLRRGTTFSYRCFDCSQMQMGDTITVQPKKLNIIEGSYSQHPYFGDVYDCRVFLTISEVTQRERILQRPAFLHQRFFEEWIPMEQQYFETFSIGPQSHLILTSE